MQILLYIWNVKFSTQHKVIFDQYGILSLSTGYIESSRAASRRRVARERALYLWYARSYRVKQPGPNISSENPYITTIWKLYLGMTRSEMASVTCSMLDHLPIKIVTEFHWPFAIIFCPIRKMYTFPSTICRQFPDLVCYGPFRF